MGDRHIDIITTFVTDFNLPIDLTGKKVLDIGVWTGGTSMLFAAMGAEVVAFEEVKMYANTVTFLADSFGISEKLKCETTSLYSIDIHDEFDYVIYSGVIYHVTDPILSLRILYNTLKDNGQIFIETYGIAAADNFSPLCVIEGGGKVELTKDDEGFNRTGWNYFIPTDSALKIWLEIVGFKDTVTTPITGKRRIHANATRLQHEDFLRAGLSRPDIR